MLDHSRPADRIAAVCAGTTAWKARPHFHAEKCACGNEWVEFLDGWHMTHTERRALEAARDARRAGEA